MVILTIGYDSPIGSTPTDNYPRAHNVIFIRTFKFILIALSHCLILYHGPFKAIPGLIGPAYTKKKTREARKARESEKAKGWWYARSTGTMAFSKQGYIWTITNERTTLSAAYFTTWCRHWTIWAFQPFYPRGPLILYAIILKHTNPYASLYNAREGGSHTWKPTILGDIKPFFAAIFYIGAWGGLPIIN